MTSFHGPKVHCSLLELHCAEGRSCLWGKRIDDIERQEQVAQRDIFEVGLSNEGQASLSTNLLLQMLWGYDESTKTHKRWKWETSEGSTEHMQAQCFVLYGPVAVYGISSCSIPGRSKCDFHPERLAGAFALAVTSACRCLPSIPELHASRITLAKGPGSQSGDENERECAGFLEVCCMLLPARERSWRWTGGHRWTTQITCVKILV